MKSRFPLWILINFLLCVAPSVDSCAQDSSPKAFLLEGTVSNLLTGAPIPGANVRLANRSAVVSSETAVTDGVGRFQFSNLSSGDYSLTAEHLAFSPGQPVSMSIGSDLTDRNIQLAPLGVITGNVLSDDGEALAAASVVALCFAGDPEGASASATAKTTTDDLGAYRLYGLPPGRCYVRGSFRDPASGEANNPSRATDPVIFYPGVASQDRATALEIAAGSVEGGINLIVPNQQALTGSRIQSSFRPDGAAIQGQVLNASVGDPVPNVRVTLLSTAESQDELLTTRSGTDGSFKFDGIPPGTYYLSGTHTGFLPPAVQQVERFPSDERVVVAAKQVVDGVVLRLMREGVITGRVLEDGIPTSNTTVVATHLVLIDGQQRFVPVSRARTNDLGEYRLFGLAPGRYYLSAIAPSESSRIDRQQREDTEAPSAASLNLAGVSPIDVAPGSIQSSVELAIGGRRNVSVSGSVPPIPGIRYTRATTILLLPRDPTTTVRLQDRAVTADAHTGGFTIDNVPPGEYTLAADAQAGDRQYAGSLFVDIDKENVGGLVAPLNPTFAVSGSVTVDGGEECRLSGLSVTAQSFGEQGAVRHATASVSESGMFQLVSLRPDRYFLMLEGLTGNCYLKSTATGTSDLKAADLQLMAGSPPLVFVLSGNGGRMDGRVVDSQRHPAKSASVVLVPEPPLRSRSDLYKRESIDASGSFRMQGIPPGRYKLFAWDGMEPESYLDPAAPFESLGQVVSIQESSRSMVEIPLIENAGR